MEAESGNVQENYCDAENLTSCYLSVGIDALQKGQELSYCQKDERLNTTYIIGEHEEIQNSYLYDAFGSEVNINEQFSNHIRYTEHQYDDLTG